MVYVLTNMETHHAYCMQAIEAGKHVLVEKPTAVTIEEIEEIKAFAHQKGVQVAPVHNYVYEAPVMRAKELIESGKLGDLVSIYASTTSTIPKRLPPAIPESFAKSSPIMPTAPSIWLDNPNSFPA